jgi:hypothetical protein
LAALSVDHAAGGVSADDLSDLDTIRWGAWIVCPGANSQSSAALAAGSRKRTSTRAEASATITDGRGLRE